MTRAAPNPTLYTHTDLGRDALLAWFAAHPGRRLSCRRLAAECGLTLSECDQILGGLAREGRLVAIPALKTWEELQYEVKREEST